MRFLIIAILVNNAFKTVQQLSLIHIWTKKILTKISCGFITLPWLILQKKIVRLPFV